MSSAKRIDRYPVLSLGTAVRMMAPPAYTAAIFFIAPGVPDYIAHQRIPQMHQHNTPAATLCSEEQQALAVRATWMRELGLSEDEITEHCGPGAEPADLKTEMASLEAIRRVNS